jgi:hypothetical protein
MQVAPREAALPRSEGPESSFVAEASSPRASPSAFAAVLQRFGQDLDRGHSALRAAMRSAGAGADPDETALLALQAEAYRYSEMLDVATRLVDRATSAVKTVLQANGQ